MSNKVNQNIPQVGESIKEVLISRFLKKNNEIIEKDDPVLEIETDKATMEITALDSGLIEYMVKEGDSVKIGHTFATIDTSLKGSAQVKKEAPKKPLEKASIEELPKPIHPIRQGKEELLEKKTPLQQIVKESKGKERREKMTPLRKTIAKRLVEAKNETAMLTTFNEVDMNAVIELRKAYQEEFVKKHGIKLGFMSFFMKAVAKALLAIPRLNAKIEQDEIVYPEGVHIGVAVQTEKGLVVPVIRNIESKSLADIEKAIADFSLKGKEGKIQMADLEGGTFTITNGGTFGSLLSTPILNIPQSGILGMHAIQERPVVVDHQIVVRPMMYLALSYDHRIVDGKEAITLLLEIKKLIEHPERGLLDL